jgi:carbon storage regulator
MPAQLLQLPCPIRRSNSPVNTKGWRGEGTLARGESEYAFTSSPKPLSLSTNELLLGFGPEFALFWAPQTFTHGGDEMLVLTRRIGEEIIIDGCIRVTITAVKGDKVRIGITAPLEIRVDREEIHRRMQEFDEPQVLQTAR